jgi:hypothetical protein
MVEWQNAAQKEVAKVKELQSSGLIGPQHNQNSRDSHAYQNTSQHASSNHNNKHVPMDVDATNITTSFKKLTDKERAKYRAEGQCFWCCTQSHMAHNCLKNTNAQNTSNCQNLNVCETTTTAPIPPPIIPLPSVPPSSPPKLSYAQQIRAMKNAPSTSTPATWARIFVLPGFDSHKPGTYCS